MKKTINFIDLFAGIGGFHKAFEKASENLNFNINCVFVSEIDNEAKLTYTNNFNINNHEIINIREIGDNAEKVASHDFLFAGFPCQTFSNAGKKEGFNDETRGTLFFDIIKILKNKKPKYFLLENVKHLIKHDNGNTWNIIKRNLIKIGYSIPENPIVLSPWQLNIPQDRQRVYIPGILKTNISGKNNCIDKIISEKIEDYKKEFNYKLEDFVEKDVDDKYYLSKKNKAEAYMLNVFKGWKEFVLKVKRLPSKTLPVIWLKEMIEPINEKEFLNYPSWKKKYLLDMKEIYKLNKTFIDKWIIKHDVFKWKKRDQKLEWQVGANEYDFENSFIQLRQSGIRCRKPEKFPTLVAIVQVPLIFDKKQKKWRWLTPRETANLQSFPKNFKTYSDISSKNNADYYSYKQFGNSINVDIVYMIILEMIKTYGL